MGKTQIRKGVFETNSSSCHSITICSLDDFDKWQNGDMVFYGSFTYGGVLITKEELEAKKLIEGDSFDDNEAKTYEDWKDYYENETYEERYTTKGGEEIIAFGAYGHD